MPEKKEQRKYERYDTEVQVYFYVTYDIRTKVKFQVIKKEAKKTSPKYLAVTKNVSAEGMCLTTDRKLLKGDRLYLEVYLPGSSEAVPMEGEVRWCKHGRTKGKKARYDIGVQLEKVSGESVQRSIYHDSEYHVVWSIVLESILGNFRILEQKRHGLTP